MDVRPPYLFSPGDRDDPCLTVTGDIDTAVVEVAVRGRWTQRLGARTHTAIRKCLAEHPAAIIVDLQELDDAVGASAALWPAADRAASSLEPPVLLVLCVPRAAPLTHRLRRLGVTRFLPVFDTLPLARAATARKAVLTDRLQLHRLPPDPLSACAARNLVGVACDTWNLRELLHTGRLVMSELVGNAVDHAGTDVTVSVWRRGPGIHLSVRDGDPRLPALRDPAPVHPGLPRDVRGEGLRIVDAAADAWGAMATHDGKVVWATLRARRRR